MSYTKTIFQDNKPFIIFYSPSDDVIAENLSEFLRIYLKISAEHDLSNGFNKK